MKTLNDYMAMSYRMEIIEDKEEGAFKKRRDQTICRRRHPVKAAAPELFYSLI